MICQNSNGRFNNRIKFKFNQKIYIKIMRCKIMRFQKLMWRNMIDQPKVKKFRFYIIVQIQIHKNELKKKKIDS